MFLDYEGLSELQEKGESVFKNLSHVGFALL